MAEEYHQTGTVCSGASWWDIARSAGAGSSGFDSSGGQAASATVSSMSCSTGVDEMSVAGFGGWSAAGRGSAASCGEESSAASASGSSVTFQDTNTAHRAAASLSMGFLMDSSPVAAGGFGVSFPNSIEHWNQSLLGRGQGNCGSFQAMLQQEDAMCASKPYQHMSISSNTQHHAQFGSAANEPTAIGQQHQVVESYPVASAPASHDSVGINLLRGLVDSAAQYEVRQPMQQQQMHSHDNSNGSWWLSGNEQQQYSSNSRFVSPPPHHMHQVKQQPVVQTLQFVNSAPYWGNTSGPGAAAAPYSSQVPTQYLAQAIEAAARPSINTSTVISTKPGSGGGSTATKNISRSSGNEQSPASFKKARVDAPSSAPAFKSLQVRKEKLGDRITALQQLVSPFGKTDTASVLFEAIEYIKFLHEQVSVLCTPYLKNGPPMQQQQNQNADKSKDGEAVKPDLRSRGLCLVPISSTFPVANEPTADFWTPTFGGSYR